jgi:hypothetical protein
MGAIVAWLLVGCSAYSDGGVDAYDEATAEASSEVIEVTVIGQRPCWSCASQAQRDAVRAAEAARAEALEYERRARERKARQLSACLATKTAAENSCHLGANWALGSSASTQAGCKVSGAMRCDSVSGTALQNLCVEMGTYNFATAQRNACMASIPVARNAQEAVIIAQAVGRCESSYASNRSLSVERCRTGDWNHSSTRFVCHDESSLNCDLDAAHRNADIAISTAHCLNLATLSFKTCVGS